MFRALAQTLATTPLLLAVALVGGAELPPELAADRLVVRAERQANGGDHRAALASLDEAQALFAEHGLEAPPDFWFRHAQVARAAGEYARAMESATRYATVAGREGEHYLAALEILDAVDWKLEALRKTQAEAQARRERDEAQARAARERLAMAFADALQSGGHGPAMVPILAGTFRMGCLSNGSYCNDDEKPAHEVRIAEPFAVSAYEVTFDEWDACVAGGGCGHHPKDGFIAENSERWGRGRRPVVNVSWNDAQEYVAWLSRETEKPYRLLSEAEWEYAARAGSRTKFSWGEVIEVNRANYCDDCQSRGRWDHKRPGPVGAFAPNAFGLHDMHGNVAEWVEDCWHDSYDGAPTNGSAWTSGDCESRVYRGGSWIDSFPDGYTLRSAHRSRNFDGYRNFTIGFRVARALADEILE